MPPAKRIPCADAPPSRQTARRGGADGAGVGTWLQGTVRLLSLTSTWRAQWGGGAYPRVEQGAWGTGAEDMENCTTHRCPEASISSTSVLSSPHLPSHRELRLCPSPAQPPTLPHPLPSLQVSPTGDRRWSQGERGGGKTAAPNPFGSTHISTNQRENSEHCTHLIGVRKAVCERVQRREPRRPNRDRHTKA